MTGTKSFFTICIAALAIAPVLVGVRAWHQQAQAAEPASQPPPAALTDEFVRPRPSPLAGTIFDDPQLAGQTKNAEFQKALEKVAAESPQVPTILAPPALPLEQLIPASPLATDAVHSLRQAASALDLLAATAEEGDDYRRADSLRKLSRRLRLEARHLQAASKPARP